MKQGHYESSNALPSSREERSAIDNTHADDVKPQVGTRSHQDRAVGKETSKMAVRRDKHADTTMPSSRGSKVHISPNIVVRETRREEGEEETKARRRNEE